MKCEFLVKMLYMYFGPKSLIDLKTSIYVSSAMTFHQFLNAFPFKLMGQRLNLSIIIAVRNNPCGSIFAALAIG